MLRDSLLQTLSKLRDEKKWPKCRIGIAGSIANGSETSNSDIDIVLDTHHIDIQDMELIKKRVSDIYHRDVDVLCMGLLQDEDKELDTFAQENHLPVNDASVYKTICREVIWCAQNHTTDTGTIQILHNIR